VFEVYARWQTISTPSGLVNAGQVLQTAAHVRSWHEADMPRRRLFVRFRGKADVEIIEEFAARDTRPFEPAKKELNFKKKIS
jgi:hypothetical protein